MSFLTPFAFLFAATLPVVIVFYMLKRRRTVKLVSSTILWQKFLAETQANAPFQKLRSNWLLLLQLLMLALAVLALARPYFAATNKEPGLLVLVLDGSASMQAKDEAPSRFESARKAALELVDGLKDTDQMVVLLAAGNTVVKQSPTSEKSALRRAIEDTQPSDTPTHLEEAFKLAETLVQNRSSVEIHLLSDGAIPEMKDLQTRNLPITYHRFGQRAKNIGVTALDVRTHPDNREQRAVFANVYNAGTNAVTATMELRFENQLIDTKVLSLPPRDTVASVFTTRQDRSGIYSVLVKGEDDLAVDNQAAIVSPMPRPLKVLLVSAGNRFLENSLRNAANVELSTASQLNSGGKGYDVVVLDDITPVTVPEVNTLAIHIGLTNWFEGWKTEENPTIVDWNRTHSLMRFVTWDNVAVAETMVVKPPAWGTTLMESQRTPMLIAGEYNRHRLIWVGFDSLQSTWPLRVSFPIFMANAMEWLDPQAVSASQLAVRAGDAFRVPLPQSLSTATVKLPSGEVKAVKLDEKAREFVWGDTSKSGVYHVTLGTNEMAFSVNLMDVAESDVTPKKELPFGKYGTVTESTTRRANLEYWRWFAGIALAVLLFEWWYYHRRTV